MSTERYPADLKVTLQDLEASGWKEAISGIQRPGYVPMSQALHEAAKRAGQEGQARRGKVLWLLEEACSMLLAPDSMNEPFRPFAQFPGRRSVIPDDFTKEDIKFFAAIVTVIDNVWLKARLADLVWLLLRPRQIQYALDAIDAYRSVPLEPNLWNSGGGYCWRRAFMLARQVKTAARDQRIEMGKRVFQQLADATLQDGILVAGLVELLDGEIPHEKCPAVAEKLEALAVEGSSDGKAWHIVVEYFQLATQWYAYAQNWGKVAESCVRLADHIAGDADARVTANPPNYSVAREHYEQAIQVLRKIPKKNRGERHIDERISELHAKLQNAGSKVLGEMKLLRTPTIDIGELVENARNTVRGKNIVDALRELANIRPYTQFDKLRESAIARMREYALRAFFPTTHFGNDGRVVAKQGGVVFAGGDTEEEKLAVWAEMISEYKIMIGLSVRGSILPALEQVRMEHRLREADFRLISQRSPTVPPGRDYLWGKALYTGYDGDYCVALHILVPQIEHMVRTQLKTVGAKTSHLDINGIETENGLSTLMDMPEASSVFGPDVSFEIKGLYCDAFGPNLRNELSHGLLDDAVCMSELPVYAWWLGMKMVYNNFLSVVRATKQDGADTGTQDEKAP